jgi:hypothetical protein
MIRNRRLNRLCRATLFEHTGFITVLVFTFAAGCSSDPSFGIVTGEVTLDGQALKGGVIRFVPADGQTPTADAAIVDGRFRATVPPGLKRVEICAPKVTGRHKMYDTPGSPVVDQVEELLPARYNVLSELTMTVEMGRQKKRFALTTK